MQNLQHFQNCATRLSEFDEAKNKKIYNLKI